MKYCEPYQSCALFGALRYFANLKKTVCLINGPTGCTFYANNAVVRLNGYFNAQHRVDIPHIYCTDFNECDAIMGCDEKVEQAAAEIIEKFHPEILFIFNCCVSEIIGSDIDIIAENVEREYKCRVIPIHTAGFKGDHKYGMRMAGDILIRYLFADRQECKKRKVNLLGEFDYFNRSTQDLSAFLNKIGITDVTHVPGKCSLSELEDASNAELNIITCQNASRYLAEQMKKKYGIPYIGNGSDLYGMENVYNLYSRICEFFQAEKFELEKEYNTNLRIVQEKKKALRGKSAVIVASTRRALGYSAILKELGVEVKLIFSEADEKYTSKKEFLQFSKNVMFNEFPNTLVEKIDEINPDFIFSTLPEIVAPHKYLVRPEVDYSGFSGVISMADYLIELLRQKEKTIVVEN